MPFPFRNPVNPSYDDGSDGGQQQTDPKLEGIVQKMIDAGKSEENIASVIKQYKSTSSSNTPASTVKPTAGTGRGSGPTPNPDTEWWKGFGGSLFAPTNDSMNHAPEAVRAGEEGALGWAKGAIADLPQSLAGGLETVGGLMAYPIEETESIAHGLAGIPSQVADSFSKAGSDPYAFGETMGQLGGQPLMADIAPGIIKAGAPIAASATASTLPMIGRGLQNVGDFVSRNQPITGMAPPFAAPRTLRLMEKGVGKLTNLAGRGMESVGNKITNALTEAKPDSDIVSSTLKNIKKPVTNANENDSTPNQTSPDNVARFQRKAGAIQSRIDDKYGPGNTDKASPSTQDTLNKTKQSIPVINRPGTFITLKNPTPDMIQQAQKLGYQFDSKTSDGHWRMRQTGRPMTINSAPTNTTMHNIDLNAPVNIGGGSF